MKVIEKKKKDVSKLTREKESGLLKFLDQIPQEVDRFNRNFEFGIRQLVSPVSGIDGNSEAVRRLGFILLRENPMLSERSYCLYTTLTGRALAGYIGVYRDGSIETLKQLSPLVDFHEGEAVLYEWMKQLVRGSCEKITL
jgi:hypothetical protein